MTGARDVLVTGVGAASALGFGWRRTLEGWRAGRHAAGPIDPFEPGDLEGVRDPRRLSRPARLVAAAALDAWRGSGLDPEAPDGVATYFVASSLGCLDHSRDFHAAVIRRTGPSPMLFTESVLNAPAGHLAIARALHGGGHEVSTLLYDTLDALRLGFEAIEAGRAARALVAGCDGQIAELEPIFRNCGVLRSGVDPRGCAPYGAARDGFRLGEAAGALILESREGAARRGARPLARIDGILGAFGPGDLPATIERAAAAAAGLPAPRRIFSSANGGPCEAAEGPWMERLPALRDSRPPIASIKPALGEAFAGTGALHLAFAALAVGGEAVPTLEGTSPAGPVGDAWVVGADPVGSITFARFLAP